MLKTYFKLSIKYGLGFFCLRIVSFLLLPLYTNLLTVEDAGVVFLVYTILAFLNPVYAYGMDSSLLKFYHDSKYSQKEVSTNSLIPLFASSFFLSLLIIIFSNYYNSLLGLPYNVLFLISIILFFDSLSARLLVLIRLLENANYYLLVVNLSLFIFG